MTKAAGPNAHGIHTARLPLASARAVAAATCSGVLDIGAGVMPSVIRPMTKYENKAQDAGSTVTELVWESRSERNRP